MLISCLYALEYVFLKEGASSDEEDGFSSEDEDIGEMLAVEEEDEKAIQVFMNPNPPSRRTIADVIAEKIAGFQCLSKIACTHCC